MKTLDSIIDNAFSRRSFLAGAGSVAAATAIGCSDSGSVTLPPVSSGVTDADILNFALNLEYLEAEFYLYAATGAGLATADIGAGKSTSGTGAGTTIIPPTSPQLTGLTAVQQDFVNELADTEQQHVRALRAALGSAAVARPNLDIYNSFAAAAAAANMFTVAGGAQIPSTFSPYANYDSFVIGVFVFEDVGVTAYNGAAPLISPAGIAAGYLTAAAGIMAVEAYHAAYARTYLTGNAINVPNYPYLAFANQIANLRSLLSGGSASTPMDEKFLTVPSGNPPYVSNNPTPSSIVPADGNALAFARTTDQVLHVVYGTFSTTAGSTTPSAGVTKGGFFPNGMNGNIKVTQS